jgi:hypothetical protein
MFHNALFNLVRIVGSRKSLAKYLEISVKMLNKWFTRDKKIRVEHALSIEILSSRFAEKKGTPIIKAESIAPYAAKQINEFRKTVIREYLKGQRGHHDTNTHDQT